MATKQERAAAADALLRSRGLEPLDEYTTANAERRCVCTTCRTVRWVRSKNLTRPDSVACRWCHGWEKWGPWGDECRPRYREWREIAGPDVVMERLGWENLAPLTPVGDEFTALGCLCLTCGETFVTMPERIHREQPGWFGCARCYNTRKAKLIADAPDVFADAGLELSGRCTGEYVAQDCTCMTCGSPRKVSYSDLVRGTAAYCWTCTHGIKVDEPHRVYLIRFVRLGVMKVGLTHDRHDRRLGQHIVEGGEVIDTVVVADRPTARLVERWVIGRYAPWAIDRATGPTSFPQGGWTEAWTEEGAPPLVLAEACAAVGLQADQLPPRER